MKESTAEWVKKAESDFRVALRESQIAEPPEPDVVCFHAQQSIEKYAKGFLTEHAVDFLKSHNMDYLHELCVTMDAAFAPLENDFVLLDDYSVDIRYPGESAAEEDARAAVEIMLRLRAFFRSKLGLDQPATPEGA